jgi:hypothetical protein
MPACAMMEMIDTDTDGSQCTVPTCDEFDTDDSGVPLGLGEQSFGVPHPPPPPGCMQGSPMCALMKLGFHRGGPPCSRHNVCAETNPNQNQFPNSDSVACGVSFDNSTCVNRTPCLVAEIKTSAFNTSRRTPLKFVCSYIQRKVLANVFASIVKELPVAQACGYDYYLVVADQFLANAVSNLLGASQATMLNNGASIALSTIIIDLRNRGVTVTPDVEQILKSTTAESTVIHLSVAANCYT